MIPRELQGAAMLYRLGDKVPVLNGDEIFLAPDAAVIGDVILENRVSIWFQCVLRGDIGQIRVGEGSNIQDGTVVHVDENIPAVIGKNCTIGHNATIHACIIGDGSLIGMGAIVLSGARIGENCLIGAGSLVPQGMHVPPGSLFMGNPGQVVRPLKPGQIELLKRGASVYLDIMKQFQECEAVG
jgi:carbonic anhydrase/acetyltransferase-like protein (isoleucine patch superfamily)